MPTFAASAPVHATRTRHEKVSKGQRESRAPGNAAFGAASGMSNKQVRTTGLREQVLVSRVREQAHSPAGKRRTQFVRRLLRTPFAPQLMCL